LWITHGERQNNPENGRLNPEKGRIEITFSTVSLYARAHYADEHAPSRTRLKKQDKNKTKKRASAIQTFPIQHPHPNSHSTEKQTPTRKKAQLTKNIQKAAFQ
jgi:hypothetical protein